MGSKEGVAGLATLIAFFAGAGVQGNDMGPSFEAGAGLVDTAFWAFGMIVFIVLAFGLGYLMVRYTRQEATA